MAGRYTLGEREDYFLLEELRERGLLKGLPRRLKGLDPLFWQEVSTRGEEVFLLYPEAGPSGLYLPLEPGMRPEPLPPASRLEALPQVPFTPPLPSGREPPPHLEVLRRFRECPFRAYVERFDLGRRDGALGWHLLPEELGRLRAHPEVGPWLEAHQEHWKEMRFWSTLPGKPSLRLDGVRREGKTIHLYRLLPQGAETRLDPRKRWTEWYALRVLLGRKDVAEVRLWAWPWMGKPSSPPDFRFVEVPRIAEEVREQVAEAYRLWREGAFPPKPGFHCHTCGLKDLCRKEEV